MKEINEAYDAIQRNKGARNSGSTSSSAGGSTEYARIRMLINQGRYREAGQYLDMVNSSNRSAEWYFLRGVVMIKRGMVMDGTEYIRKAMEMDPDNEEYAAAYRSVSSASYSPFSSGRPVHTTGCSGCDICTCLLCTDCLTDCLCNCLR